MPTTASPRISHFLARLIGPIFVVVAIGVLTNGAAYRTVSAELARSTALIYLSGLLAMAAGVAILLHHNVWAADWRVLITLFGWIAVLGGAQRIIWPQGTEGAVRWSADNPTIFIIAGIIWLIIGGVLCFYGYRREPVTGAIR
jgi:hypothetical protein